MDKYDVLVVGAGPAGGQCARLLKAKGYNVCQIEKVASFKNNNFSSAATLLETIEKYNLPKDVVQSYWSKFEIWVNDNKFLWEQESHAGAIMDFEKLRTYLAKDVIFNSDFDKIKIDARVFVDATGPERIVMYGHNKEPKYETATGLEYVLEVTDEDAKKFDELKTYWFLGKKWVDYGYLWIFNAGKNKLKIGAGSYNDKKLFEKTLKDRVEDLIKYFNLKDYQILDVHGSTLKVTIDHTESFYKNNIIAVGDAISAVNWLGGEGIRHGLYSATVAAEEIDKYLKGENNDFSNYQKRMKNYFGMKWVQSFFLAKLVYFYLPDSIFTFFLKILQKLSLEELNDILFHYQFIQKSLLALKKFVLKP